MARILVVDDEDLVRESIASALKSDNHDVSCAAGGAEVLDRIDKGNIDLLILDILMPGVDGIEVLEKLKARWPDLPVIVISGGSRTIPGHYVINLAQVFGADAVLYKPFSISELQHAVATTLGQPSRSN